MLTLSYGFQKPDTGDKGSVFFPALEDNIQQINDHTHNGLDSAALSSSAITPLTATLLAASWVALGGGNFRQLVTLPGSMTFDNTIISMRVTGGSLDGHVVYPSLEKVSPTTYYAYTNDATQAYKAVYGS